MFYIFSTILSKERSQDVGLFGSDSLRVSYLTYAWFVKLVAMTVFTIVLSFVVLVVMSIAEVLRDWRCSLVEAGYCLILCAAVLVSVIPVVLVQESVKLSWALFFLHRWEPKRGQVQGASLLYAFLEGARKEPPVELYERQAHLVMALGNLARPEFPSSNSIADRAVMSSSFLYRHLEFLCCAEETFLKRHRTAYQAAKADHFLHHSTDPLSGGNHLRKAYTPLSSVFDAVDHPLGYLNYSFNLWGMDTCDLYVYAALECIVKEQLPLDRQLSAEIQDESTPEARDHREATVELLAGALRDREVHQIVKEFRGAKSMFLSCRDEVSRTHDVSEGDWQENVHVPLPCILNEDTCDETSASLLHAAQRFTEERGFMESEQRNEPLNRWARVLQVECQLTSEQMEHILALDGFQQKVEHWKFERIFHPKRLAYYFDNVPQLKPRIDLVSVSHTFALRSVHVLGYVFWIWFAINSIANCGFSIVFMFYSFATTPQNLLQILCFWSAVGFLALALSMLPAVLTYARLLPALSTLSCLLDRAKDDAVAAAHDAVASYYKVSTDTILAKTVSRDLLPDDLRQTVASLLGDEGVDKGNMSRAECIHMKRQFRRL
ncbi:membrane-associated protein, putative [Bodo saltans]|uniref:Membrane-associated protein, putative n=1 Tax=Bodo saltans TaxID=75058 RepID=A0A0S4J8C2_BODSA|nr:membrane-associated protein, putative [Bodo saltans]|eukprot:CUG86429.1 membrane-associated protein, putative [Bodo saltans]